MITYDGTLTKPLPGTPINWTSQQARGLLWLAMPGIDNRFEKISGGAPTYSANSSPTGTTPLGSGVINSTSGGGSNYPAASRLSALSSGTTFTIIIWAKDTTITSFALSYLLIGDNTGGFHILGFGTWSSGQPQLTFVDSNFSGNNGWIYTGGNLFLADGKLHQYAVTRNGLTVKFWRDGVLISTQTAQTSGSSGTLPVNSSVATSTIGLYGKSSGGDTSSSNLGTCLYGGIWSIDGSNGLVQDNYVHPFGMFDQPQLEAALWTPATGGGGTNATVTLTATVATSASLAKGTAKVIAATSATSASLKKGVTKTFTATSATAATLNKGLTKTFTATQGSSATVTNQRGKLVTLVATVTTSASVSKGVNKVVAATQATSATIAKRAIGKQLAATVTTAASVAKGVTKTFTAVQATAASVTRTGGAVVNVLPTTIRAYSSAVRRYVAISGVKDTYVAFSSRVARYFGWGDKNR